jgi:hypothetical protein
VEVIDSSWNVPFPPEKYLQTLAQNGPYSHSGAAGTRLSIPDEGKFVRTFHGARIASNAIIILKLMSKTRLARRINNLRWHKYTCRTLHILHALWCVIYALNTSQVAVSLDFKWRLHLTHPR